MRQPSGVSHTKHADQKPQQVRLGAGADGKHQRQMEGGRGGAQLDRNGFGQIRLDMPDSRLLELTHPLDERVRTQTDMPSLTQRNSGDPITPI